MPAAWSVFGPLNGPLWSCCSKGQDIGCREDDPRHSRCVLTGRVPVVLLLRYVSAGMISMAATLSAVKCPIDAGPAPPAKVLCAASGIAGLSREKPRRSSTEMMLELRRDPLHAPVHL